MSLFLQHANIVQVFDFGEQDGELYMAMEYIDGTTGASCDGGAKAVIVCARQ